MPGYQAGKGFSRINCTLTQGRAISLLLKSETYMRSSNFVAACFVAVAVFVMAFQSNAQVVINDKNLNEDKSLEYIQLMYLIDKATLKPIFFVDYGMIEPEYNEIIKPDDYMEQKITIDGEVLDDRITVVGVLNRMYKAGWAYMGDVVYVPIPMMDNWHIFTLKRR